MLDSSLSFQPESDLLEVVFQPLLEGFQYWFDQGRSLLEMHELDSLGAEQQADLPEHIKQAEQKLAASQVLLRTTQDF